MFKLKKTTPVPVTKPVAVTQKLIKFSAQQIHDEFETAINTVIETPITADDEKLLENYDRLSNAGFWRSLPFEKMGDAAKHINHLKKGKASALHFKEHYPFNKFITQELVLEICKKYGLVFGETKNYKGDIPEKNIKEILDFKLKDEHRPKTPCGWYTSMIEHSGSNAYTFWSWSPEKKTDSSWGYLKDGSRYTFVLKVEDIKFVYLQSPMMICAPVKDFNMDQRKVSEDGVTIIADDPVVLQPVTDGYLIVSKWGEEANDEKLVNEIYN